LGKVRPERVKKIARELIRRHPAEFSTDFESNKKSLDSITKVHSSKLRNQIAGYITRLVAVSKAAEAAQKEEEGGEQGEEESE